MIGILNNSGRSAPIVKCDMCGKQITDAALGMAMYDRPAKEGDVSRVWYLHKGECDMKHSLATAGKHYPWQELSHYLYDLCANSGLSPSAIRRIETAERIMDRIGRLP